MPGQRPPFNAEALTAARSAAGLSRAAVAEHLGIHRQRVYDWEQGASTPHARQLPALAEAVGVGAAQLVTGRSLRSRRYAAGLTQEDAAAAVGVSRPEWSRWESGLRIPQRYAPAVERLVGG
ncbi:MAG: helix-turn-helix transcriptional regulator [Chloroflexi bacterium]|nr:helix-turn-helix transcriptional regulator [Chloroflexota bacterium]